jgi:shikimate kinase
MGSGKTTVGRHLSKRLGRAFFDSDHEIETRTGVNIATIFEIEGEAGFRRRETQVIDTLTREHAIVLATGGGVVLDAGNRETLRARGWVVYLNVPPDLLFERTRLDRGRPLLHVEDPLLKLRELHALRDPLYRETAHFVVDGKAMLPFAIVQLILKAFAKRCEH